MYGLGSCVGNPRKIWVREWILQHLWDHGSRTKEEKVTRNESLHKTPICVLHQDLGAEADSRRKSTAMLPCSWEASGSQGLWDTVIIHLRSSFPLRKKKWRAHTHQLVSRLGGWSQYKAPWKLYVPTQPMSLHPVRKPSDNRPVPLLHASVLVTVQYGTQGRDACMGTLETGGNHLLLLHDGEFVLLSHSHIYCSKRNLKELNKVTKREKQIWKRVFKASCLESMAQLQSPWLSAHCLPPFSFPIKDKCSI